MVQHLKNCIDNGQFVGCIGMDLSKAFDCLPHGLTICKLRAYGASRNACTLLASYLYCRKQRVRISNECSDWGVITKGFPQGSILCPLIFNIFLNDIFYFAKECYMFSYADDNYISVNHKELKLVRDAKESKIMVEWLNSNSLQANPCKFQGILFKGAKKVNDFRVYVEGTEIEFQSEIDELGVCIYDDMNFNSHVNNVCKKAGKQARRRVEWLYTKALLWQISTTALLSGSLHQDLVSVNWKKSRKGPCDLYCKILCHAMTNSYLKQRWMLSGSAQWKKWRPKYSKYWIILALAILKIISKKPEILTIYVIITNQFSQWNLLHPME